MSVTQLSSSVSFLCLYKYAILSYLTLVIITLTLPFAGLSLLSSRYINSKLARLLLRKLVLVLLTLELPGFF